MIDPDALKGGDPCQVSRLWAAVIEQAVDDLRSHAHLDNALQWLRSDNPRPGGFRWICDHIGLEPPHIRKLAGIG